MDVSKIVVELTLKEAKILRTAIAGYLPPREDEMISMMLYTRITRKIEETTGKHEPL